MAVNQLKAGVILSYIVIGLNSLVGILYTPFMLRMLGQSEYGLYSLATSIIAYLGIMDLGFGNAIIRYVAKYKAIGDKQSESNLLGMFSVIYIFISIFSLFIGVVVALNTNYFFDKSLTNEELSQTQTIMFLLALNLAVTFLFNVYASAITAYEDFIFQKIVQIVRILLNTGAMIALLFWGYKAVALVICQTVFNILTQILNYYYFHFKLKIKISWGNFDWGLFKEICCYSFWIFITTIIDRLYWSTGPFILGAELGTVAVAIFSVAMTLEHIFLAFSTAISGVFLPRVTKMIAQESTDEDISSLFIRTGRLQFIVISLFISAFIIFGNPFINLWAGKGYQDSYPTAILLFAGLLIPLIQNIGVSILQARNDLKFRAVCYLILSIGCVAGQCIFSQYWGAIGCGIAIAITLFLGQGIAMNLYYWKKHKINIPRFWSEIFRMSIIPILLTLIGIFALHRLSTIDEWGKLFFYGLLFCLIYSILMFKFALNRYEKDLFAKPIHTLLKKI